MNKEQMIEAIAKAMVNSDASYFGIRYDDGIDPEVGYVFEYSYSNLDRDDVRDFSSYQQGTELDGTCVYHITCDAKYVDTVEDAKFEIKEDFWKTCCPENECLAKHCSIVVAERVGQDFCEDLNEKLYKDCTVIAKLW